MGKPGAVLYHDCASSSGERFIRITAAAAAAVCVCACTPRAHVSLSGLFIDRRVLVSD